MQREGSGGEAVALAMVLAWLLFWSDLEPLGCLFPVKMFVCSGDKLSPRKAQEWRKPVSTLNFGALIVARFALRLKVL